MNKTRKTLQPIYLDDNKEPMNNEEQSTDKGHQELMQTLRAVHDQSNKDGKAMNIIRKYHISPYKEPGEPWRLNTVNLTTGVTLSCKKMYALRLVVKCLTGPTPEDLLIQAEEVINKSLVTLKGEPDIE